MNVKEKAKAYDKALEFMKDCTPDENGLVHIFPCDIFPELKENEDEKIRLKLIEAVKRDMVVGGTKDKQRAIAWLEAQGKQKPAQNYAYIVYCRDENNDYFCGVIIASDKKECIKLFRKSVGNYKFNATRLFKTSLPSGIAPSGDEPFERFIISEGKYT